MAYDRRLHTTFCASARQHGPWVAQQMEQAMGGANRWRGQQAVQQAVQQMARQTAQATGGVTDGTPTGGARRHGQQVVARPTAQAMGG